MGTPNKKFLKIKIKNPTKTFRETNWKKTQRSAVEHGGDNGQVTCAYKIRDDEIIFARVSFLKFVTFGESLCLMWI